MSSERVLVFYAGLLLLEFDDTVEFTVWRRSVVIGDYEIYSGSYVYYPQKIFEHHWCRTDGTPCLLEDVPKELRTLALLLT